MTQPEKNLGSLLSRMTEGGSEAFVLDKDQVTSVIEVLVVKIVESMPGMPPGMTCNIVEKDDNGWTLRINRPLPST